jgi:hypothetical protein
LEDALGVEIYKSVQLGIEAFNLAKVFCGELEGRDLSGP